MFIMIEETFQIYFSLKSGGKKKFKKLEKKKN